MKRWTGLLIAFTALILFFITASYLGAYLWAMGETLKACSEGDYELCEELRTYADSRIKNLLIILFFWTIPIGTSIYYYHKRGSIKK
jgi:hypothetical protein